MANINPINSQGTKIYVVDVPDPAWTDCTEAVAAIIAGKQVLCPQSLGDLTQTRSVTEYKCLSTNDSVKIMGAISRGNLPIGMLFDPEDIDGQAELVAAFEDNTNFIVGIEFPDVTGTGTGGTGTIKWFEGAVSEEAIPVEMDAAILYNSTVEVCSAITTCAMVPNT